LQVSNLILHQEALLDPVLFAPVPSLSYWHLLRPMEEEVQHYLPTVVRRLLPRHRRFFRCPRPPQRARAAVEQR
jgi:hypothetical protein